MKFKEGSVVEVLKRNEGQFCFCFPAKILLVLRGKYSVRYELLRTPEGKPVVEIVKEENVRPCPPLENGKERWFVGDKAEVFDLHSWRVAKVAKVLKNNHVVVRIFGSIQLKEYHISNLRVRQAWRNNQWVMIDEVSREKQIGYVKRHSSFKCSRQLENDTKGGLGGEGCTRLKPKQNLVDFISPRTSVKRDLNSSLGLSLDDMAGGRDKERKNGFRGGRFDELTERALHKK